MGGSTLAALLARRNRDDLSIRVWEREKREDLAEGFNLQLDHNLMASLEEADIELANLVRSIGVDFKRRTHRKMSGEPLMDVDVHEAGLTTIEYGSIVRWDIVTSAIRDASGVIEHGKEVVGFKYSGDDSTIQVEMADGEVATVDMLVVSNGRYSAIREVVLGEPLEHNLAPGLMNFRFKFPVTPEEAELVTTHERVYNLPDESRLKEGGELAHLSAARGADPLFENVCMKGHGRLGVLPLRNRDGKVDKLVCYGNFKLTEDGRCPPEAKTADGLKAIYAPPPGVHVDELGQLVMKNLLANTDKIHWARCQTSPTAYHDDKGRVLLNGDSASAFFPMLTQGSAQAIEDAVAASAVILAALDSAREKGTPVDVKKATSLVADIRKDRRTLAADLSREHAQHMVQGGQEALDRFTDIWTGKDGGVGRKQIKRLYSDYPRFGECYEKAHGAFIVG